MYILYIISQLNILYTTLIRSIICLLLSIPRYNQTKVTILIIRYYPFQPEAAIYILYIVSQLNILYSTLIGSITYLLLFIPRYNQTRVIILLILAGFHILILVRFYIFILARFHILILYQYILPSVSQDIGNFQQQARQRYKVNYTSYPYFLILC